MTRSACKAPAVLIAWTQRVLERAFNAAAVRVRENVVEQLSVDEGVRAVVKVLNGELRPFAKPLKRCIREFGATRANHRAEFMSAVGHLVSAALAAAPVAIEASCVARSPAGAPATSSMPPVWGCRGVGQAGPGCLGASACSRRSSRTPILR